MAPHAIERRASHAREIIPRLARGTIAHDVHPAIRTRLERAGAVAIRVPDIKRKRREIIRRLEFKRHARVRAGDVRLRVVGREVGRAAGGVGGSRGVGIQQGEGDGDVGGGGAAAGNAGGAGALDVHGGDSEGGEGGGAGEGEEGEGCDGEEGAHCDVIFSDLSLERLKFL